MGRPVKHTPDLLRELLDAMVREPHSGPKKIAKKKAVSPATFYNWQRESAEHEKAGLTESPWLVEWLGNVSWFHRHCQFCRAVAIAQIDARIIEGAICSRTRTAVQSADRITVLGSRCEDRRRREVDGR